MSLNFFRTSQGIHCMDYDGNVASLTTSFQFSGTSMPACIMRQHLH